MINFNYTPTGLTDGETLVRRHEYSLKKQSNNIVLLLFIGYLVKGILVMA